MTGFGIRLCILRSFFWELYFNKRILFFFKDFVQGFKFETSDKVSSAVGYCKSYMLLKTHNNLKLHLDIYLQFCVSTNTRFWAVNTTNSLQAVQLLQCRSEVALLVWNITQKITPRQMFLREFCIIFQVNYFLEY